MADDSNKIDDKFLKLIKSDGYTPEDQGFNYKKGYLTLFNTMTDITETIKNAQIKSEQIVIDTGENGQGK